MQRAGMFRAAPLDGRVVVVIGGTTGLGLSGARACLAAGARGVVVVGRNPDSVAGALGELGAGAAGFAADASDSGTGVRAVELALERHGACDALYHVAGGSGRRAGDGPLHEMTDEGLAATVAMNLNPVLFSNRAAVRHWLAAGRGGVILNMGSVLGWSPSPRHFATHAYAAVKAAVAGYTRSAAAAYAPAGIRLNVVAPALVETPMARRAAGDTAIREFMKTKQPLEGGRLGVPEDVDGAVVFLLSDASRYVTGQVVTVDGGWSVSEGQWAVPGGAA